MNWENRPNETSQEGQIICGLHRSVVKGLFNIFSMHLAKCFKLKTPTVNPKKLVISKTVLVWEVSKTDIPSFFLSIFRTLNTAMPNFLNNAFT